MIKDLGLEIQEDLYIMTKEELKTRTKTFALRVFKFLMAIERSKPVDVISYQLLKASSSVAANYRAVCRGKSDADFLNKLKTVDEEADELVAIFSASIRTIKSKNPES